MATHIFQQLFIKLLIEEKKRQKIITEQEKKNLQEGNLF